MDVKSKVVVAMSGGVDSSVAAALLVEAGYEVTGMMLRLWSEPGREADNRCCTPDSMAEARRVARTLGIPFYVIDAKQAFRDTVVESFIRGYSQGVTPNPCLVCNRQIRWGLLLENALAMGAELLATGHYAQVRRDKQGYFNLYRGADPNKDQSYVLSVLDQHQLARTLLPVGGYTKPEVREWARKFGLSPSERADSQDLCFLAGQDYRDFIRRYAPEALESGDIVDSAGTILARHAGLANYTIGQRKGLGIASDKPLYVLEKVAAKNTLIVGEGSLLGHAKLSADQVNWMTGVAPVDSFQAEIKVRYRSIFHPGIVKPVDGDKVEVGFDVPVRDITPGQRAVFYAENLVLGGGNITAGYD